MYLKLNYLIFLIPFLLFSQSAKAESLEKIKEAAQSITSIRSDFIQEKHLKILKTPLISKGTLIYRTPDSLRWEYKEPIANILFVNGGKTSRFLKNQKGEFVVDASANIESMQFVMQQMLSWLNGDFKDNDLFLITFKAPDTILLSPKAPEMEQIIQTIDIRISPKEGVVKSVTIYENKDSFTRILFQNSILNEKIDDTVFQKKP